ncbi:MAG: hypothetical protein JWN16_1820, partial [Alphaproteobacteria bacterium]|nr:hypothetical protein [Alphaproteobacteria bacterium]
TGLPYNLVWTQVPRVWDFHHEKSMQNRCEDSTGL